MFAGIEKPYVRKVVPATNGSQGFDERLLDLAAACQPRKDVLLVAETVCVIPTLRQWLPESEFTCSDYDVADLSKFAVDLCAPQPTDSFGKSFDLVFNQATLEHLCRPALAIENMLRWCKVGGCVVLHTVGPGYPWHPAPDDCCRFFEGFWRGLQAYLPCVVRYFLATFEFHQFVVLERT